MTDALLEGIVSKIVGTPRLKTHLLTSGPEDGVPVLFIHGNISSSRFFEETMAALPPRYRGLAPDLRGFGESETKPVDATRGLRDFADDLHALVTALAGRKTHLVGWSVGSGIAMQYAMDHPAEVASLTLIDPLSPYGFGGTKDAAGRPCWPDYAGSGGGTANPEFVKRLATGDRSEESDFSPRKVMNAFFFKPPFRAAGEREEIFVSALLSTKVGDDNYPGDMTTSPNWPTVAPGTKGTNNAISPKYCNLSGFAQIAPKPDLLWMRGADDQIVSDTSLFDFGYLGQLGAVPGWPGAEVFPPQPMAAQMRAVLEAYRAQGGQYHEEVIPDCGHSPHIEKPEAFRQALFNFLGAHV
ncbi:MAG: alpha/beta hydrolase [Anaerolineales bacterium]|nr:alpha/beta hydrolase [Anaerolineales bacterium]